MEVNCVNGWFGYDDRCYKYSSTPTKWTDAESNCQSSTGTLVKNKKLINIRSFILCILQKRLAHDTK